MRAVDGLSDEVLSGAVSWGCRVSSWLGATWLGDVPVAGGRVASRVPRSASDVQHTITITVPRYDGGRDWCPGSSATHPLARFGQELDATILVGSSVSSDVWEVRVGRFLITDWDDDDEGTITVTGESLLRRVADDRPAASLVPSSGGTLASEARRILPAGMGVAIDSALVDRAVPESMAWSRDRLAALTEIASAWPARLRVDEWGQVRLLAPLDEAPVPVLTLRDGERGTLVSSPRSDTRDDAFNRVIASSSAAGSEGVYGVAEQTTGPMRVSGPYGVVTKEWSSPLLTTSAQAEAAARTMLANAQVPASTLPVVHAPDPRVELDDPVAVVRDGVTSWGWVVATDLPLTVKDIGNGQRTDIGMTL